MIGVEQQHAGAIPPDFRLIPAILPPSFFLFRGSTG